MPRILHFPANGVTATTQTTFYPASPNQQEQRRSTEHATDADSSSSPQQEPSSSTLNPAAPTTTSSVTSLPRPMSRRDDPSHPLASRPATSEGLWHHLPLISFFSISNVPAEEEFETVGKIIADTLHQLDYKSYSVSLTHAGFSISEEPVPVIVCTAADLELQDAERIQSLFDRLERRYIREIFLYQGSTRMSTYTEDDFCVPKTNPDCGFSIGPANSEGTQADPNCSSSLGIYVRIQDDEQTRTFVTGVHHGLGEKVAPTDVTSLPRIQIQHPSKTDMRNREEELEKQLQKAKNESHPRRREHFIQQASKRLDLHRGHDTTLGSVHASELEIVYAGDEQLGSWSDWCLIEVCPNKVGKNVIAGSFQMADEEEWIPRDREKLYIRGIGDIRPGEEIRKAGRATGETRGAIEFAYSFASFEGTDVHTREWCVVTSPMSKIFSGKGDSGAPVVCTFGEVIGFIVGGTAGRPMELVGHENLGPVFVTYISDASIIMQRIANKLGAAIEVIVEDICVVPDIIASQNEVTPAPKVVFASQ